MSQSNAIVVIIDDDKDLESSKRGFFIELRMEFKEVRVFDTPSEGIEFIQNNLQERILVLLDIGFPANLPNGHIIMDSIRSFSFLIPVIIWSGVDQTAEPFADFINNKAFAFLSKVASNEDIVNKLKEAYKFADHDVSVALEDWIATHSEEERAKPYMLSVDGKELSLNDILKEIRLQTDTGKQFSKKLTKLTIDLLIRKKESLND